MARNLDMTALRAFVAVADAGGVTRAAGRLNLTQSAVSMQLRRLEDALGQCLFARANRKLSLTSEGEQMLGYGRRMLELNDEALSRLSSAADEGEIRLGVPHDIVYPQIPPILKRLAQGYPRMRINLVSSFTITMREEFARGVYDVIVTTEERPGAGAEVLAGRDLVWIGAPNGTMWQRRPLRLGFKDTCIFRASAQAALERAGIPWEMAVDGDSEQVVEATVAADLAVSVRIAGALPPGTAVIDGPNALPALGRTNICLYRAPDSRCEALDDLLAELRCAYGA